MSGRQYYDLKAQLSTSFLHSKFVSGDRAYQPGIEIFEKNESMKKHFLIFGQKLSVLKNI